MSQLPLAAEWTPTVTMPWRMLDERQRGTKFVGVPVRSVLNSPATTGMGFWSLNPYVGCEFGCTYCYARETHRWAVERASAGWAGASDVRGVEPPWLAFERRILVKQGVADVLARTLNPKKLAGHSLVIGTATDPYQPAERKFRLTRQVLEQLLAYRGLSIGLITKSPLVTRDRALLVRLAERHEVSVNISLVTLDARLARRLEPRSPAPHARIRALGALTGAGIHAGLLIAPIIPGLTDDRAGLSALMQAGKAAGARYVVGSALRLGPAAKARFLPHLAREFPGLVERYHRRYGDRDSPGRDYTEALARRLRSLQQQFGFPVAESMRRRRQLEGKQPKDGVSEHQSTLL